MTTTATARLTADEQQAYERDGFLLRERVFDAEELARICAACEDLVDKLARNRRGERMVFGSYVFDSDKEHKTIIKWEGDTDIVHGVEPFVHLSPELEELAYDPRFIEPSIDLLGVEQPALFTEKLNLKRPHHGGANPLHQDYPYWRGVAEEASEIVTAMLFLDDSTLANGCLHVAPGSHRSGAWQGRSDGDRFAANEIDQSFYEGLEMVPLEVAAGSMVLFGPYLVHQSAPNTSDRERRALLYSYQPPGRRTQLDALTSRLRAGSRV